MTMFQKSLMAGSAALTLMLAACTPGEGADAPAEPVADDPAAEAPSDPVDEAREDIPPLGQPALWTVADEDTTIHMFGTVHILKPETEWQTDELDAALDAADAIYFEADVLSEEAALQMATLVPQLGVFTDGTTLSSLLDEGQLKEVEEAAAIVGVPMAAIEPLKPWLATVQMSVLGLQQQGYDAGSGVEVILTQFADENDLETRFLETAEEQLQFFAGLPMEDQVDFLVTSSIQIEDSPTMLDDLVEEWATGDIDDLALIMSAPDVMGSDAVYDALLVDRNETWTTQIKGLLDAEAGTFVYAVGAAHLAGDDSVVAMLRADGLEVTGP
ncbi:MAG: TraB/GumN family protein [Pseudomonadota bacterium]